MRPPEFAISDDAVQVKRPHAAHKPAIVPALRPIPVGRLREIVTQFQHAGRMLVDERQIETTVHRVYAGGDAVTGAATVILAAGAGKRAAEAIHADLIADREKTAVGAGHARD